MDVIKSRPQTKEFDEGYDRTFRAGQKAWLERVDKHIAEREQLCAAQLAAIHYEDPRYFGVGQGEGEYATLDEALSAQEEGVANGRIYRPHRCERCDKFMPWDDQQCACTARRA